MNRTTGRSRQDEWTPERHIDGVIRERAYATYDEEWDDELVAWLTDEVLEALTAKTGYAARHFQRGRLEQIARDHLLAARSEGQS